MNAAFGGMIGRTWDVGILSAWEVLCVPSLVGIDALCSELEILVFHSWTWK